jgi:hypothetical protein
LNEAWHKENRLPKSAGDDERLHWHAEHALECGCRPMPPDLLAEAKRRGLL